MGIARAKRGLIYLVLGVCLLGGAVARGDNRQLARDAYREGSRLYDLTDYRGALEAFRKAYVLYEEPTLLFNIAQCHRYLGQKAEAVVFYRNYLRKAPNSQMAEEVRRLIAQLDAALEQEHTANSAPPAGTLGPDAHAAAGRAKTSPAETPPATTSLTTTVDTPTPRAAESSETPLVKKWWLWTAVGGGVVVIALGVGLGVGLSRGDSPYPSTNTSTTFRF